MEENKNIFVFNFLPLLHSNLKQLLIHPAAYWINCRENISSLFTELTAAKISAVCLQKNNFICTFPSSPWLLLLILYFIGSNSKRSVFWEKKNSFLIFHFRKDIFIQSNKDWVIKNWTIQEFTFYKKIHNFHAIKLVS